MSSYSLRKYSMKTIPAVPEDINENWLNSVLSEKFPGVEVADCDMTHLSGGTNHHVHISARYRESAGAPESLFCKFLPCDPTKKELIANTNMGLREARFYKEVAPLIELRMPEIYYAECDQHDGAFVVLMENIETSGCSVSDGTQTVSVDSAARALEELANMHRQFESPQAKQILNGANLS